MTSSRFADDGSTREVIRMLPGSKEIDGPTVISIG
jgi:hypothetical protein